LGPKDLTRLVLARGTTDARLAHLKSLTSLELLDLNECPGVTNAGLKLKELTTLSDLFLKSATSCSCIPEAILLEQPRERTASERAEDSGLGCELL